MDEDNADNKSVGYKKEMEMLNKFLNQPAGCMLILKLKQLFSVKSPCGDNINEVIFNHGQLSVIDFIERIANGR